MLNISMCWDFLKGGETYITSRNISKTHDSNADKK